MTQPQSTAKARLRLGATSIASTPRQRRGLRSGRELSRREPGKDGGVSRRFASFKTSTNRRCNSSNAAPSFVEEPQLPSPLPAALVRISPSRVAGLAQGTRVWPTAASKTKTSRVCLPGRPAKRQTFGTFTPTAILVGDESGMQYAVNEGDPSAWDGERVCRSQLEETAETFLSY